MLRGWGIKHTRVFHNSYLTILNNKTRIYLLKKRVQSFSFAHAAKELNKKETKLQSDVARPAVFSQFRESASQSWSDDW